MSTSVVAHRAGNALGSLRAAEAAGIRTIEADVQLVGGEAMLRHPSVLRGRELSWEPWARAGSRRRTRLADLLACAAPETTLLLDLKGRDARLPAAVQRQLDASPVRRPVVVCGRAWALLEPFDAQDDVRVFRSAGTATELLALLGRDEPGDGACVREHLLDARLVRLLREHVASVLAWTVNSPGRAEELLALGVDGVISDDLHLLQREPLPLAA